jgi:Na+/H+-dicarboxylate symporter
MPSLNKQIFIAAIIGILIGAGIAQLDVDSSTRTYTLYIANLLGTFFIDLLKMVLVPLVFTSIFIGVARLQQHRQASLVWKVTLIFFLCSMGLAMLVALIATNWFKPGADLEITLFADAMEKFSTQSLSADQFFAQFLHSLFQNPFAALASGSIFPIIIFALILGIAVIKSGKQDSRFMEIMEELFDLIMRIVGWIMVLAPLGIAALLCKLVATQDSQLIGTLGSFIILIFATTLFHAVVVLPLILYIFTKKSPLWFWRGAREALITAFATSSSSATLPVTLNCVENKLGVSKPIAGFVVPLGATINMDGTALYEASAALFVANLAGIDLTFTQQLIIFCTAMIAAMGAPGIPSAGMVTMIMVLESVGLPVEAIAILLPIDRLLDTIRTAVNVQGDMIGSLVVESWVNKKTNRALHEDTN